MDFTTYVRKPFRVQAVRITKENIEEIATKIGRIRYKRESGEPFIRVNSRVVPNVPFVYLGFYMTEMGDNIRCYSGKIFEQQFVQTSPEVEDWISFLNRSQTPRVDDSSAKVSEEPVAESVPDDAVVLAESSVDPNGS